MSANEKEGHTGATNRMVEPDYRKRKLVKKIGGQSKTKYYVWLGGHATSLVFGTVTLIFQIFWLPNVYYINSISYRLCLLGATTAFLATMSHKFGLHYLPPFTTLLVQHNFQYLILAIIWCFTFKSILKILPLYLISLLQLSEHKKVSFIQKHSDSIGSFIGFTELLLMAYLLLRTIAFRSTSGYQFAIMSIFLWLRILFDPDTARMFAYVVDKADSKISTVKNEKVTKAWGKAKKFLHEKQSDNNLWLFLYYYHHFCFFCYTKGTKEHSFVIIL